MHNITQIQATISTLSSSYHPPILSTIISTTSTSDSNKRSYGIHYFKVLVQIHYPLLGGARFY